MRIILLSIFVVLFTGCGFHIVKIETKNEPLNRILYIAKKSLPFGIRTESENGRELYSNYFRVQRGKLVNAKNLKTRKYIHIWVLGDQRPYTIKVEVVKERRNGRAGEIVSSYSRDGYDKGYARAHIKRMQKALSRRKSGGNIVDDFRVF